MTNLHGTPIWYELTVPDPDAAGRFYGAVIGWQLGPPMSPGMDYRVIEAGDGQAGGVMRLTDEVAAAGMTPGWTMYLGVDDVDRAADAVARAGGQVRQAPWTIEGVGRMAYVSDRQGVPFYVMRGASDEDSTAFSPSAMGRCGWNELAAPDPADAVAFYGDLFGWSQRGSMPMGEHGDYLFLQAGEVELGAVMRSHADHPPGWTFTFRVDDAPAAADRLVAAGGTLVHPPVEVPGGDLVVGALDPWGLRFGVFSNPAAGDRR